MISCKNRGIFCVYFKISRLSVVFKNFSIRFSVIFSQKYHLSHHHSHVCSFLDTICYICLCLLCVGCSTFPPLLGKLYLLYSVPLITILSSYLLHLPFSLTFFVYHYRISSIFVIPSSVFVVYVASSLLTFLSRWHVCSGLL